MSVRPFLDLSLQPMTLKRFWFCLEVHRCPFRFYFALFIMAFVWTCILSDLFVPHFPSIADQHRRERGVLSRNQSKVRTIFLEYFRLSAKKVAVSSTGIVLSSFGKPVKSANVILCLSIQLPRVDPFSSSR